MCDDISYWTFLLFRSGIGSEPYYYGKSHAVPLFLLDQASPTCSSPVPLKPFPRNPQTVSLLLKDLLESNIMNVDKSHLYGWCISLCALAICKHLYREISKGFSFKVVIFPWFTVWHSWKEYFFRNLIIFIFYYS